MTRSRTLSRARRLFTRRRSRLSTTLLAAAAILVAGCTEYEKYDPPRKDYSDIKVEWVAMGQDVAFRESTAVIDDAQLASVHAFLDRVDARLTDQIALDPGAGAPQDLSRARADAITQALGSRLPGVRVRVLAEGSGATPQLIVGRYVAIPPECVGWYSPEQRTQIFSNPENTTDPNFGCATSKILAAMVADPGDLKEGRQLGPVNSAAQMKAIGQYRTVETPHPYAVGHHAGNVRAVE